MRRRSSGVLLLGLAAFVSSWALGSTPLAVVAFGIAFVGLVSRAWSRLARRAVIVDSRALAGERLEGADVAIEVIVRRTRRLPIGTVSATQKLGETTQTARFAGPRADIVFRRVPRGRHLIEPVAVVVTDPVGLDQVEHRGGHVESVLVRPRIPVLGSTFAARGAQRAGSARTALRAPAGLEFRGVRDHIPGESLRAVHWPSTARRGRLVVKELDDTRRDELAVILDQDAIGVAGPPGQSSFDAAVRAAGALALAQARRGRGVLLAGTAPGFGVLRIRGPGREWEVALDALAEVMPADCPSIELFLSMRDTEVARMREIVVVTGRPDRAVAALREARERGCSVSLVAIATETFAGRARAGASTAALRAAADGIPVAVIAADSSITDALMGTIRA